MDNYDIFKEYLDNKGFYYQEGQLNDGTKGLAFNQDMDDVGTVRLAFFFPKDIIDITLFGLGKIDNPLRRDELLKLVNEVNLEYRFPKFQVREDGTIDVALSILVSEGHVLGEDIFNTSIYLFKAAHDVYPKFMKLKWS